MVIYDYRFVQLHIFTCVVMTRKCVILHASKYLFIVIGKSVGVLENCVFKRKRSLMTFTVLITRVRFTFREQLNLHMSHRMTKPTKWHMRPVKTPISFGIHPVWSESSLCAQWVAKDSDSENSDRTGLMPRLIWVFVGREVILVVLSRAGSYIWIK